MLAIVNPDTDADVEENDADVVPPSVGLPVVDAVESNDTVAL